MSRWFAGEAGLCSAKHTTERRSTRGGKEGAHEETMGSPALEPIGDRVAN